MSTTVMPASELTYIAAILDALPNMVQLQKNIILEYEVDGDGGEDPFRFTFDFYKHRVTLAWDDSNEVWGLESVAVK